MQVALGGEKNFVAFMNAIDEDPSLISSPLDADWYKKMIAKVIIFKTIESLIKKKDAKTIFRQGYVNIAAYTVSIISDRLNSKVDLILIWQQQCLSSEFEQLVWEWAKIVNGVFVRVSGGRQFSEVAKQRETWVHVSAAEFPISVESVPELKLS